MASNYELPGKLGMLFAVMAEDYGRKGDSRLRDLLQKSEYSIEEGVTHDNWNGGTYGHAVHFQVPGDIYFEIIDNLAEIGTELQERSNALSTVRNEFVSEVTIEIKNHPSSPPQHEPTKASQALVIPAELRQDIFDFLKIERIHWAGHLDETEFLQRLYDLSTLESHDNRFSDAAGDIWQHRVNNPTDWEDDWVFSDPRFDLLHTSDEGFIRFLCETMHPVLRRDVSEVNYLQDAFNRMLSSTGWQIMPTKYIGNRPVFSAMNGAAAITLNNIEKTGVTAMADAELDRLWGQPGFFRVFLSHKAEYKVETARIKEALLEYGVTCFVAHEDIEPNREWQDEIENALFSMEACVALLTPEFHNSNWTDQEIGVAIGRRVPIVPVRLGFIPYGFVGKYQALNGQSADTAALGKRIFQLLLTSFPSVQQRVVEAMVTRFERVNNCPQANELMSYFEKLEAVSPEIIRRLEAAPELNAHVKGAYKVKNNLPGLISRFRGVVA